VREHDAFRSTGAAAGEEDDVRIRLSQAGFDDVGPILGGGLGRKLVERQRLGAEVRGHAVARPDALGVHHEQGRAGGPGGGRGFLDRQPGVHRCEHAADLGEGREQGDGVERRRRPDRHPITEADAEGAKDPRRAVGSGVEVAERQHLVAQRRGRAVGGAARRAPEHVADKQVHPARDLRLLS
jgi:hypothetical protein